VLRAVRADAAARTRHDVTPPLRARSQACVRVPEKWRDAHLAGERGGCDAVMMRRRYDELVVFSKPAPG